VDDTIATLYVDGVALNTRLYAKAGQALAVYVVDGTLTVENAVLAAGLQ
jgi:beta-fructofuranosidase